MLRFSFFAAFLVLLFFACGRHDLSEDLFEEVLSSSSVVGSSSSAYEQFEPSSSSVEEPASSSSSAIEIIIDDCDFINRSNINAECFYEETVVISRDMLFGSQARLTFAENASLQIDGYNLKIADGAELYFGKKSEFLVLPFRNN